MTYWDFIQYVHMDSSAGCTCVYQLVCPNAHIHTQQWMVGGWCDISSVKSTYTFADDK